MAALSAVLLRLQGRWWVKHGERGEGWSTWSIHSQEDGQHSWQRRQLSTWPKDGKHQGGHKEQRNAVECCDWRKKAKESTCANKDSLHKNNNNNKGRRLPGVLCLHISVALQQKAANFKVAFHSRQMQWSLMPEEKQKNQLSQTVFRCIKTIVITGAANYFAAAITWRPSLPHQRW
jgi:hypothetical protein